MKKHRRIITLILAMLLTFSATVFVSAEPEEQEVVRLGEVQALRETNSETYLLSDGSYECVVYAEDKYYLDDTDTLQLIDHTLKAETSGLNTAYTNTAGSFDVEFSGSGTPQVSIAYEGNSVTFSPLSDISLDDPITANDHVARIGQVDNCLTLENITPTGSNTVTYEEVFTATDLVYVLDNDGVKEYIILNSTDAPNEFSFMFQLDGLEMQTIENETFFMDEEGIPVFRLGQLFAVDGADELTNELTYSFTPVKGTSNVIVTVTLSEDYLSDPAREFPVVIDPSIMISSVQTADACVMSYYADYNYYTSSYLRTGYDSDYGIRRSFIRFDIPSSIPEDSVTESLLYFEKCGGVAPTMRAHRCILPWESATLTWNNQPLYNTTHDLSYSPLAERYSPTSAWYVLDVTNIVASWVDGLRSNYGFALVDITEDDEDHWTTYYSSDMESPHKPELHITYNGTEQPPVVTPTLTISKSSTEVDVGNTVQLTATTYPSTTISWSSSNTSVATVNSSGRVIGKSLGTATITASANGLTANCTVYVTLTDDVYIIRSKYSEQCVDIEYGDMVNGTTLHQWSFNGSNTQKWYISHIGQGIYIIESMNSTTPYYMGVSGDSVLEGQPIVLRTGPITNGMRWKIETTLKGGYRFTPISGESYRYALSIDHLDDYTLIQSVYASDTVLQDEWFLEQEDSFGVIHYYDHGYAKREPDTFQKLYEYHTDVASRLTSIFGVNVTGTFVPHTSKGDECRLNQYGSIDYENLDSKCLHTSICLTTSKLRSRLIDNVGEGSDKTSLVLWTGHRMDDDLNDRSNSLASNHSVIITPYSTWPWNSNTNSYIELSAEERQSYSEFTLMHELSHQLSAPDHYCYGEGVLGVCTNLNCDECWHDMDAPRQCLMSEVLDISDYDDETLYCTDCVATILEHLYDHH